MILNRVSIYFFVTIIFFQKLVFASNPIVHNNNDVNNVYYKQFKEVFEFINSHYVNDPDKQKIIDASIDGMLYSLDKYSLYLTDDELEDFMNHSDGNFGGIGVEVVYKKDLEMIEIIAPIEDLPAYNAGLRSGDCIVSVNDQSVASLGFYQSIKAMRGKPGTKVKLGILKEGLSQGKEIEIVREIIHINPVKVSLKEGNIAYIKIITFNKNTISSLKKAIDWCQNQLVDNGKLQGIILDLRNNPGGLLDQAVAVSEYFIDSGIIVTTKGRGDKNKMVYTASNMSTKAPKIPMIVIINYGSASASEIVAGSLQDHKRAIILGEKSYGKASVQSLVRINSRSAVKLTTAKYYTPSGKLIDQQGIIPDIYVEQIGINMNNKLSTNEKIGIQKNDVNLCKEDYQISRAYDLLIGLSLIKSNTNE